MAEWSNAAVLKTVVLKGTGGSNPSLSAKEKKKETQIYLKSPFFVFLCKEARGSEGMDLSIPLSPFFILLFVTLLRTHKLLST